MLLGAAIAGLGALASAVGQHNANIKQRKEAEANRRWQEQQTSTAHQRQVKDLRAAGLNPILSANSGASSGAGSQATQENIASSIANSAGDVARMSYEKKKQTAEIEGLTAGASQSRAQAAAARATAAKTAMETAILEGSIPESEMKSGAWKWAKQKMRESAESHAQRQRLTSPAMQEYMEDFDRRVRLKESQKSKTPIRRN